MGSNPTDFPWEDSNGPFLVHYISFLVILRWDTSRHASFTPSARPLVRWWNFPSQILGYTWPVAEQAGWGNAVPKGPKCLKQILLGPQSLRQKNILRKIAWILYSGASKFKIFFIVGRLGVRILKFIYHRGPEKQSRPKGPNNPYPATV